MSLVLKQNQDNSVKLASEGDLPSGNKYLGRNIQAEKSQQDLRLMKSPRRPHNTQKTQFACQMKQYETTKPIKIA